LGPEYSSGPLFIEPPEPPISTPLRTAFHVHRQINYFISRVLYSLRDHIAHTFAMYNLYYGISLLYE